jgi:lysophospholipid acyltransferase (LPLAT)-like uncharacterized protein
MSLRKRIEKSEFFAALVARIAGLYLAFCYRTTSWRAEGVDDLRAVLKDGPVLLVIWHSRSMMAAMHWPVDDGSLSSLYDRSPVGRIAGALHRQAGLQPMEMSRKVANRAASRTVLRRVKDGISIGLTGDGPLGPALQVKDAPLDWARATGIPIFCYAFSTTKSRRLQTWDQILVPKPFGKGAYVFRQYPGTVQRKVDAAQLEALRSDICDWMNKTTHEADTLLGLPPGP